MTNPLISALCSVPVNEAIVKHTNTKEENGSEFWGHAKIVHTIPEAAAVRDALFQLPAVSQCDHVIYVYSIADILGMKISGHSDGGEWAASKLLVNLIEERGLIFSKGSHDLGCFTEIKHSINTGEEKPVKHPM